LRGDHAQSKALERDGDKTSAHRAPGHQPIPSAASGREADLPLLLRLERGGRMRRITKDDAIKAVGAADDVVIAQIIGTGASVDELAEAQAWVANDEPLMNAGKPLPSGRVGELVDILSELQASEEEYGDNPVVGKEV
jgi:hypothetical protein